MTTGLDLIHRFEDWCPTSLAESWDHVGLQLGDPTKPVHRVLTCLDVRPAVVEEAIAGGFDFIFSHHPLIFKPARDLDLRNPQNAMYARLLGAGITVYSAHTNLDSANGGMNDWLADQLQLTNRVGLVPNASDPTAFMGRVGDLPQAMTPAELAAWCEAVFAVPALCLITPDPAPAKISRVAVLGGAGGSFINEAVRAGAQAYVTGDLSYHVAQDAQALGLVVVDPGHHIEVVAAKQLARLLDQWGQAAGWDVEVAVSQVNTEPFEFVQKG